MPKVSFIKKKSRLFLIFVRKFSFCMLFSYFFLNIKTVKSYNLLKCIFFDFELYFPLLEK